MTSIRCGNVFSLVIAFYLPLSPGGSMSSGFVTTDYTNDTDICTQVTFLIRAIRAIRGSFFLQLRDQLLEVLAVVKRIEVGVFLQAISILEAGLHGLP
jgi:hypothetical protein